MVKGLPGPMARLVEELGKMPGIGTRTAQRIAFYLLKSEKSKVNGLLESIKGVKNSVSFCRKCNNLSEHDLCEICSDPARDKNTVCVVEGPAGIIAMEKSGVFKGVYHVLLGELSPLDGVGPEDLKIEELLARVRAERVQEVIIATDFTTEGETTALYIQELLKPLNIKVTRPARGVPVGASLEYADVATIQRALEERRGV